MSVLENEDGSSSRKAMKTAENKELAEAVFKLFLQQKSTVCLHLKRAMAGYGIKSQGTVFMSEKLSADPKAAENFIGNFKIEAESYDPEFLYNLKTGTVLLQNLYVNPQNSAKSADGSHLVANVSDEEMQEHYDNFFEDVFVECEDKYGEIEEMNVCDNLGDHLVGNVYIK
ncbi:hypothetical protein PR048_010538, partial [Dryococelus australis]